MKYLIIGLGNYGKILAEQLTELGHEVIATDIRESRVELVKDKIVEAITIDAVEEQALDILPLTSVDVVIVTIGEFGASIRVVAQLKQRGVKHIYARSLDEIHNSILKGFNIDKILTPEEDAARRTALEIKNSPESELYKIDEEHYIIKFLTPKPLIGKMIKEIEFQEQFKLNIITVLSKNTEKNFLGMTVTKHKRLEENIDDYVLQEEDWIVCFGTYNNFISFWKRI